jgi:hypothetical protein
MIKVYGLSDELQQLAIQCLKCSGFSALHGNGELYCSDDGRMHPMVANKLTLEEWCFSVAPDWVECIQVSDGEYFWTNDTHCQLIGKSVKGHMANFEFDKVLLRRTKPVWQPEVGETVVWESSEHPVRQRCKVIHVNYGTAWLKDTSDHGDNGNFFGNVKDLKPVPKYTDEQLTAYEMYCDHTKARGNSVPSTIDKFLSQPSVCGGVIYFNLTKAGWKKCN